MKEMSGDPPRQPSTGTPGHGRYPVTLPSTPGATSRRFHPPRTSGHPRRGPSIHRSVGVARPGGRFPHSTGDAYRFRTPLPPEPGDHLGWGHSLRREQSGNTTPHRIGPGPVPEQKGGARQWIHSPRSYGLPRTGPPPPPPRRAVDVVAPSVIAHRSDPATLSPLQTTADRHRRSALPAAPQRARLPESPTDPPHRRMSEHR